MRIINPDGSTFSSWTKNSNSNALGSYYYAVKPVPTTTGTYHFEAVYNGDTCVKKFKVNCIATDTREINLDLPFSLYPNPLLSEATLTVNKHLFNASLTIYNSVGQIVRQIRNISGHSYSIQRKNLPSGLYFLSLAQDQLTFPIERLLISQ